MESIHRTSVSNVSRIVPNYGVVVDTADFNSKRIVLADTMMESATDFNTFVLSTVGFFYGDGNNQIAVINSLIEMAFNAHGYNANKLADYLACLIPHNLDKKTGDYPVFGKKLDGHEYPDNDVLAAFVFDHPIWARWSKVAKEKKAPSMLKEAAKVLQLCDTNGWDIGTFCSMLRNG